MPDDRGKTPAFQFYPKDFLSDEHQVRMSLAAVGIYTRLMCHCWNGGSLPADLQALARLSGASNRQIAELWPSIAPCFLENGDGRLTHQRLDRERLKQDTYRQRQSDKGKASAAMRTILHDAKIQPSLNSGSTVVQPSAVQPEGNSAVCSLQTPVKKRFADVEPCLSDRYAETYGRVRGGAHYQVIPKRDGPAFEALAAGWPLERLEKMLELWLQMPAKEGNNTPGTPGQFLNMAPHVDRVLRENGL